MKAPALLLALALSGCGDLPPMDFVVDGARYTLPAERHVPKETAVAAGIEVILYGKTSWAAMQALNCGDGKVVGCTLTLPGMCMVWLLDPALIPADVAARVTRHEKYGHCNGYRHVMYQTPEGPVVQWDGVAQER